MNGNPTRRDALKSLLSLALVSSAAVLLSATAAQELAQEAAGATATTPRALSALGLRKVQPRRMETEYGTDVVDAYRYKGRKFYVLENEAEDREGGNDALLLLDNGILVAVVKPATYADTEALASFLKHALATFDEDFGREDGTE